MKEYKQKRIMRKRVYSKPMIILLIIILAFLIKGTIEIFQKSLESRKQLDLAREEFAELQERSKQVNAELAAVQSSVGQEEELRRKFSLAKEGEQAVIIIEEDTIVVEEENPSGLQGFWEKVTDFFSGQ